MIEWAAWWDKTLRRWEDEGFPREIGWEESVRYFGLDPLYNIMARPYGPNTPPQWYGGVADEAVYEIVRPFLYPQASIDELLVKARGLRDSHRRGDIAIRLWLEGYYEWPRSLLGDERTMYAYFDQPDLIHRINTDTTAFSKRIIEALLDVLEPDMVGIVEDMSYNNGPMFSRAVFDEFLAPYYRQIVPVIKQYGIPVLVDSDGQIEKMIPWLQDVGVDGAYPLERQAGVDVPRIREMYPNVVMMGGYDKMVMDKGEAAMRAEFERLLPVMRSGGYVLSVDHQTPPGVSLEQYKLYVRLLEEYAYKGVQKNA